MNAQFRVFDHVNFPQRERLLQRTIKTTTTTTTTTKVSETPAPQNVVGLTS